MIDFGVTKPEFESAIFRVRAIAALHKRDGRKSTLDVASDSIAISHLCYIY